MQDENINAPNNASPNDESSGNAALDKRLASGVLKGDSGTDTAQVWISAFLMAALGFVVYLGSFSIPLHGADQDLFHDSRALDRIVTSPGALGLLPTSPLSAVGLATVRVLTGDRVDGLHGISILLHLGCAVLVFLIARRLLSSGTPEAVSMLAGMLFVAHPLATGAVNYLVAFPILQSTFFSLLAVLMLLRGAAQANFCVASLAGAIASFTLAFGSDTAALLMPVLGIALIQLRPATEGNATYAKVATPALVLTAAVLWIVGQASGLLDPTILGSGFSAELGAFLNASGNLLLSFFWPLRTPVLPVSPGLAAGLAGVLVLLALLASGLYRRQFPVVHGALWTLIALFGATCYAPTAVAGTVRYLYLPLAGLSIILPWALSRFQALPAYRLLAGAAALLVVGLGFISFQRTATWMQPDLLWRGEAELHPDQEEPLVMLGEFQSAMAQLAPADDAPYKEGLYTTASDTWKAVLERVPGDAKAQKQLGMIAMALGKIDEARPLLESASATLPEDQELAIYLGYALEQAGRGGGQRELVIGALRAFRRAERLGPLPREAQGRYGMLASSFGEFEVGLPLLKAAIGEDAQSPLKAPYDQFSKMAEQVQALSQRADAAASQNPGSMAGIVARAEKLLMEGRSTAAFYLLQLAMPQAVGDDATWATLGLVSARMEGSQNFIADWGASRSGNTAAWEQLATRCALAGSWDAAELYLRNGLNGIAGAMPELKLAAIAVQAKQAERAMAFLDAAQKAYPDSPVPWLQLADMSIASQNFALARGQLDEAEKRGAAPEEVKARRDKLGAQGTVPSVIERTVIQ